VKRPFLVRHQVSCQAGLHRRYQLESRSEHPVNPFCQHGLRLQSYLCLSISVFRPAWDGCGVLPCPHSEIL
jgi:hypothetical protein